VFFLFIFHCRYFHLYSWSYCSFPLVYKYLCSETGCRNNFVTYLCALCIYCLCNKSIKFKLKKKRLNDRRSDCLLAPPATSALYSPSYGATNKRKEGARYGKMDVSPLVMTVGYVFFCELLSSNALMQYHELSLCTKS